MRYRLFLDNCVIGKNQIVLPYEIGKYLQESATVYIDDNPVYTEIFVPDGQLGSLWDETSSPSMERVGTGFDCLLTFEAPHACQYIDVGDGVGESLIQIIGSFWDETSSPAMERITTTNTDCNVMGWWVVDELGWLRTTDETGNQVYVNVAGTWKEGVLYLNVGGTWKEAEPNVNVSGTWK